MSHNVSYIVQIHITKIYARNNIVQIAILFEPFSFWIANTARNHEIVDTQKSVLASNDHYSYRLHRVDCQRDLSIDLYGHGGWY